MGSWCVWASEEGALRPTESPGARAQALEARHQQIIGQAIKDLEVVAQCSSVEEFVNKVEFIPLR